MSKVALVIANEQGSSPLSPFFAKAYGVRIVMVPADPVAAMPEACDEESLDEIIVNHSRTSEEMCDIVIRSGVKRVLCGFIDDASRTLLGQSGITVTLAPCNEPAWSLVRTYIALAS